MAYDHECKIERKRFVFSGEACTDAAHHETLDGARNIGFNLASTREEWAECPAARAVEMYDTQLESTYDFLHCRHSRCARGSEPRPRRAGDVVKAAVATEVGSG